MKIAILVALFPPEWLAGTEIATYNISKHLAIRGYEVHVITSLDKGLPRESTEQGFYIHRIGWQKVRFLGAISFWLEILATLREIKPDIVHSQDVGMGMPGFLAKKLLKKPHIVWGRGIDVYDPGLLMKPFSKLVLQNADTVIALTKDMKGKIQEICNREIRVIPNGIDLQEFNSTRRNGMQYKRQADTDEKLIIYIGRFRSNKGVNYLIEAMNIIRQKNQCVRLLLGGDGPEEENLKYLTRQLKLGCNIDFLGQIPNKQVPQYMAAAYVFVLPSLNEGFPNVVLEAMASGLPIIASKVGGLPEIIKEGENGFLVEPRNPGQIAEKVLLLLQNTELRKIISTNNKEKAKVYSWESVIDSLEEVYQSYL